MKWKVLSSRYIAKDPPWFTTKVDTVQLPSGEILDNYYILEYPDWIAVIALTKDRKMVMVEQYRHAVGKVSIELSAGVIDDDESPLIAAKRELLEETGYGGGEWKYFMKTCANPGTHTNYCHVFLATDVDFIQDQELDRTEDINVKLMELAEVKSLLNADKIIQSMHSAALWKYISNY